MKPGQHNERIIQGADWFRRFTIPRVGFDFTGWNARMKVCSNFGTVVLTATVSVITATQDLFVCTALIPAADSTALDLSHAPVGRIIPLGYWDIELYLGDVADRYVDGRMELSREATI